MFVAVIGKLLYVEVINSEELQSKAASQWMRDLPLTAERGEIFDTNGVLLADSKTSYVVYVRPNSVSDKDKTALALSNVFGMDYGKLREKLNTRASEITIKRNVDKEALIELLNYDLTGVYYGESINRVYPYGDFMTQLLGFTNTDSDGQTGLELRYNDYLKGKDGYALTETDLIGRELNTGIQRYVSGTPGYNAQLTVDYYIQAFAENAVKSAELKYQAKSASCIVMDINTGAILAMAEAPSFDLNNVPRDNVAELLARSKSSLISNVFEPGSTFKIVTAGVGLETGAVSRNATKCYCPGYHIVDGQRIRCWKSIGHGSQTFDEGVQNSCNVLFMNTALSIGTAQFYDKIRELGLTEKTGIDLVGEGSGLVIKEENVKNVDLARIGFGQAIAVTPMELLRAAAAVVNGGNLVTPYILDSFTDKDGNTVFKNEPKIKEGVLSEATSASMRDILEGVVSKGSGKNAKVDGYKIGGKTGTAQKYENGHIAQGKYVSTFLGFAPADKPQYIALMIVDEPVGAYYGSIVAAPYIGEIYRNLLSYKEIAPSLKENKPVFEMPDLRGKTLAEAAVTLRSKNIYFDVDGESGVVKSQIPAAGALITEDTAAVITVG